MAELLPVDTFNIWRPSYGGAVVEIRKAGLTTLASVYTDPGLTNAAANPQTLDSKEWGGVNYGKFSQPLYTNEAFEIHIGDDHSLGVVRPPLTSLASEVADDATVQATDTTVLRSLNEIAADVIHASQFGTLASGSGSASANTTILTNAIGEASSDGGGEVHLPPGTFYFTTLTIPTMVTLVGAGRDVTVLASEQADKVITIGGDEAGMRELTLDGVSVQASSTGVYAVAKDRTRFRDVTIKRFETNIHFKGGSHNQWRDLYCEGATNGAKLHGDLDSGDTGSGDIYAHNFWSGRVKNCTTFGIELSFEDKKAEFNSFTLECDGNTGPAMVINGAQQTQLIGCWFNNNTKHLDIKDDTDTDENPNNQVIGLRLTECRFNGNAIDFADRCQDVIFSGGALEDVDITLTSVEHFIIAEDVQEDALVTLSGAGTKWGRRRREDSGKSVGITTDATSTEAWSTTLEPGEVVMIDVHVTAIQTDDEQSAMYNWHAGARRPGSTLDYDAQTANFTAGETLTGTNSGATAKIQADSDSGASGTLTLIDINGDFENNEPITDGSGGAATADGTLTAQNAVLALAKTGTLVYESVAGWDSLAAVSAGDLQVMVQGAASDTVEWHVHVAVYRTE